MTFVNTSKILVNVIWSGVERFSAVFVQILCTIIIARVLSPHDFGIIGILLVFYTLALTITESGFGQALIRERKTDELDYSSVFYFNIGISILIYLLFYVVSEPISHFYNESSLKVISKFIFIAIPVTSLCQVQNAIMIKGNEFKKLSIISIGSSLISGTAGVISAYILENYWALVIQVLVYSLIKAVLYFFFNSWRPKLIFSWKRLRRIMPFSFNILGTSIIGVISDNLYSLIIGKVYSATDLGFYTQARRIQQLPASTLTTVILNVFYPLLSEIRGDKVVAKRTFLSSLQIILTILWPVMSFFVVSADFLFPVVLTPKWNEAIPLFKVLCIVGAFYPIHMFNINLLKVAGQGRKYLLIEVANKVIMLFFLFITLGYDLHYLVLGQALYYIVAVVVLDIPVCGREFGISFFDQLKCIFPAVIVSSVLISSSYIVLALIGDLNSFTIIWVLFGLNVVLYFITVFFFRMEVSKVIRRLIGNASRNL